MNDLLAILNSNLSRARQNLSPEQTLAVATAMSDYSLKVLDVERAQNNKAAMQSIPGLLHSIWKNNFVLWVRKQFFNAAVREAKLRAYTERRKIFVIRHSMFGYTVLSTKDVDFNRKLRIIGKNVNANSLHDVADYIVLPTR